MPGIKRTRLTVVIALAAALVCFGGVAHNARISQNIAAVFPPPGCNYTLLSIEDMGQQDPADVPWFKGASQARGFDMKLDQLCPGQQPTPRTIRVIAIPSGMGGYWAEAALKDETG